MRLSGKFLVLLKIESFMMFSWLFGHRKSNSALANEASAASSAEQSVSTNEDSTGNSAERNGLFPLWPMDDSTETKLEYAFNCHF